MEYKISSELLQAIVNTLQALPYSQSWQVMDKIKALVTEQNQMNLENPKEEKCTP